MNHRIARLCLLAFVSMLLATMGCRSGAGRCDGDVTITNEAELVDHLDCGRIEGRLLIDSDTLESFGWPGLESVGGALWVWGNNQLSSFNMENLERVGKGLLIRENSKLMGFNLSGLVSVGGSFGVVHNTSLSMCRAEELRDSIGIDNIAGNVEIVDNRGGGGC